MVGAWEPVNLARGTRGHLPRVAGPPIVPRLFHSSFPLYPAATVLVHRLSRPFPVRQRMARVHPALTSPAAPFGAPFGWLLLSLLLALLLGGCAVVDPSQRDWPAPGVSWEETLVVDGLPERLLIRGQDARNPVLLFLHGGPGFPAAPFRQVNHDLERYFTVVHWDQRGTGHSYLPGQIPEETMRVEQFVRETLAVTRVLCRRFGQRKIYLIGHSWGTLPAILAAGREPRLYHAYIALSQLVDLKESQRRLTAEALARASRLPPDGRAERLRAVGPTPYRDLAKLDQAWDLIASFSPPVRNRASTLRLAALSATSRYYTLFELQTTRDGYRYSRARLIPQLYAYDLRRQLPRMDTPVYFFVGQRDVTFGLSLQEDYYRQLRDPAGKHFVVFRDTTHWPHIEQPRDFLAQMRRVRDETWHPGKP